MKAVCTKKNLNQGLNFCSRIIGGGTTLPVLNNILLRTENGRIKLSSTNLELAIHTWVGGKVEEEGDITVPAKLINEYINNIPAEQVTLSSKNQTLYLEGERAKSHIKGLSSEEFPLIPQVMEKVFTQTPGGELTRSLKDVAFAASFSETQPEISGVLFNFQNSQLTLAATDRYRLAETKVQLKQPVQEGRQVIVPARSAAEAARILSEQENVEIYLSEGQIMFRTPETEIISRLIDGSYPDYQQIVPKNFTTEATLARNDFVQALKAVSLFASENNNIEIVIGEQKNQVLLKSQSAQTGDSEVFLEADLNGPKNSVIFNHRYLLECLNSLNDEKVILKMIDSTSPAVIVPSGRDNYLYIVMPIKT